MQRLSQEWVIYDFRDPVEEQVPTSVVRDEDDLTTKLRGMIRPGEHGVVGLTRSEESAVSLGLGEDVGFVQIWQPRLPIDGKIAISRATGAREMVVFFDQGRSEPIWPENLLPINLVIELAAEFFRTGEAPTSVRWGERVWRDGGDW